MKKLLFLSILLILSYACTKKPASLAAEKYKSWNTYAGTKEGIRYSSDDQIDTSNVKELEIAWRYSTNDKSLEGKSQNQCNPIVVDGILYGTSPAAKLFALDAKTGKELWLFDPNTALVSGGTQPWQNFNVIRGVVYWENDQKENKRIFYSLGSNTFCVDAVTGKIVSSFGDNGRLHLEKDLDRSPGTFNPFITSTTPGIIYKDLLILSVRVVESGDAAPGHIRAYNALTGELRWIFHTIPHPGEVGYDSWPDKEAYKKLGGANNWAGMALDEQRGIVYVPTGSVSEDFYGGIRKGDNLFGNSLIALDAATGKYIWHFQIVHHDMWDRDLPANPNLVTLYKDQDTIDAVAQITKHGYIFLFDRATGQPIFDINEMAVPQNALPGEFPSPTQPIPVLPEPFARQSFTENDVSKVIPENYPDLLERFRQVKFNTMFTPPSKEGVWIFPGFDGGGEWGGAAVDPETQILYINSSEQPWSLTMIDKPASLENTSLKAIGKNIYQKNCIPCHGPDRAGVPPTFPSLIGINEKLSKSDILNLLKTGRNMMPSFQHLSTNETEPLLNFILELEDKEPGAEIISNQQSSILDEVPFIMTGYNRFQDKDGYPGITPPWGTLNAVDLLSGKLLWKVPLGEFPELTAKGVPITGTENYGGSVVTKGGLVFIAATMDAKIRAFDKKTGKQLWAHALPVPGYATPAVYSLDGKQYLVIACGGGKIGSPSGDEFIAFSLPD